MKRIIAIFLAISLCFALSACAALPSLTKITYSDDFTEMYYNGHTYINYNNYNGKYRVDMDNEEMVHIATVPYGMFFVLGAVTKYYGNDAENPDFIANLRTIDFFVREDVIFDHSLMLSINDAEAPFLFSIADVTTGEVIANEFEDQFEFEELCNFYATFADYPSVRLWITISEYDGRLYLQDVFTSDYYAITNEFKEDLYRFGINDFDYHFRT